jgi:1-acyl-sn-glycerol-3-phosphate acyltransferase
MTSRMLACFRAVRLVLHLLWGALLAIIYPSLQVGLQKRIMQRWSARLVKVLHVRVSVTGDIPLHEIKQGLIVANHISWIDVYVMSSVLPMRFVAKSEVRSWPFIGWLCTRAQTIFIERNKRSDTIRTNLQMVEHLQQTNCVAIFPEGTTSDGSQVRHFHASLLQPAIDAQTPIYPVAIHYHDKHNKPNPDAAYIDEMSFGDSLWKILCSRDLHARVSTTVALSTQTENRRVLALKAHQHITRALSIAPPMAEGDVTGAHDHEGEQSPYSLLLYAPAKPSVHKVSDASNTP